MIPIGDSTSIPSGVSRTDSGSGALLVQGSVFHTNYKEIQKMIRMNEKDSIMTAKQVLAKNHDGANNTAEVLGYLQSIRQELIEISNELKDL